MELYTVEDELSNDPYKCFLTVQENTRLVKQFLCPLLEWIDPNMRMIRIAEDSGTETRPFSTSDVKRFPVSTTESSNSSEERTRQSPALVTPSLAVMLFLSETGDFSHDKARRRLLSHPWKLHHSIELSNKWSETVAGRQDFYSLSSSLPLCSVCAVCGSSEILRFTLFVSDFVSMVEFYRIITDCEMESQKPGFCIFPLYSQPGFRIELCLKFHRHLKPYPLPTAYMTFKIRNITALKDILSVNVREISRNMYAVKDPEGNLIVLHDVSPGLHTPLPSSDNEHANVVTSDITSLKSGSDSHDHDSGRFSDSDICDSEPVSCENLNYHLDKRPKAVSVNYSGRKDRHNKHTLFSKVHNLESNCRKKTYLNDVSDSTCKCNKNKDRFDFAEKHDETEFRRCAPSSSSSLRSSSQLKGSPETRLTDANYHEGLRNNCECNVAGLDARSKRQLASEVDRKTSDKIVRDDTTATRHHNHDADVSGRRSELCSEGKEVHSRRTPPSKQKAVLI